MDVLEQTGFYEFTKPLVKEAAVDDGVVACGSDQHELSDVLACREDELVEVVGVCGGSDVLGCERVVAFLFEEKPVVVIEAGAERLVKPVEERRQRPSLCSLAPLAATATGLDVVSSFSKGTIRNA